jgi:tetratricopeptide (TPR) repeat protein
VARGGEKIKMMLKWVLGAEILVGMIMAAPIVCGQVQENPNPKLNPDWEYQSPGPKQCVEIGNVYLHKGKLKGALSRFQEAVKDDPHYAPAYLGLGKVYDRMNEKQKALDAYLRYFDELPSAKDAADAREVHRAVDRLRQELNSSSHNPVKSDQ